MQIWHFYLTPYNCKVREIISLMLLLYGKDEFKTITNSLLTIPY